MRLAAVSLNVRNRFFGDIELERSLATANATFWSCLLRHIDKDFPEPPGKVLDVGCHDGGLLALLGDKYPDAALVGIEPVEPLRAAAAELLVARGSPVRILGADEWDAIGDASVDLLVCHEVLYLLPSLQQVLGRFRRVLATAGRAYIVLGCHAENPVWPSWKALLAADGITAYDHRPFQILDAARGCGLVAEVQPLRREGWIRYDPAEAVFAFPDIQTMFDHHYRQKLIFRLQPDDGTFTPCP